MRTQLISGFTLAFALAIVGQRAQAQQPIPEAAPAIEVSPYFPIAKAAVAATEVQLDCELGFAPAAKPTSAYSLPEVAASCTPRSSRAQSLTSRPLA